MQLDVVTSLDAATRTLLTSFDASFSTTTVYDVDGTDTGFRLVERTLAQPFTKRYQLLDDPEDDRLPWDILLLARSDGEVRGLAGTSFAAWNRRQVLSELHVAPTSRRQGVARLLLERVRETGRANGAREVWLETQTHNVPAIAAYRRLGFRLTGIDVTIYPAPHEHEVAVFMSQPL